MAAAAAGDKGAARWALSVAAASLTPFPRPGLGEKGARRGRHAARRTTRVWGRWQRHVASPPVHNGTHLNTTWTWDGHEP